jgi:CTP:molybdopterin cytidylyltransferase MocA
MDYYEQHGRNAALTCRYFGISRQTFYRWRRRYRPQRLASLEESQGLRGVIATHQQAVREAEVSSPSVLLDINTPEEYREALTRLGGPSRPL